LIWAMINHKYIMNYMDKNESSINATMFQRL
jgi:hypothetical protein